MKFPKHPIQLILSPIVCPFYLIMVKTGDSKWEGLKNEIKRYLRYCTEGIPYLDFIPDTL